MGFVTTTGIPVYLNNYFLESAEIPRETLSEKKLWDLPFWTVDGKHKDQLSDTLVNHEDESTYQFELVLEPQKTDSVNLHLIYSPRDCDSDDLGIWIFELRRGLTESIDFPIQLADINRIQ